MEKQKINYEELDAFLKLYSHNNYIYPSVIARKFKISCDDATKVLDEYKNVGLIGVCYQVKCPICNRHSYTYLTVNEIPEEVYCPHCDEEIYEPTKHIDTIYQKR